MQYDDLDALLDLRRRMQASPRLQRLVASILFIEQPINRKHALDMDVSALSRIKPMIIDESDAELIAFPSARALARIPIGRRSGRSPLRHRGGRKRMTIRSSRAGRRNDHGRRVALSNRRPSLSKLRRS